MEIAIAPSVTAETTKKTKTRGPILARGILRLLRRFVLALVVLTLMTVPFTAKDSFLAFK
jgi:hypothetical protein